eukprot:403356198
MNGSENIAENKSKNEKIKRLRPREVRRRQKELHKLQQEDPIYIDYAKPFSATPYYDYFDNFVLGFKIETDVPTSADCIDSLVYSLDDWTYFQNNITDLSSWESPILNFTRAIGGNLSTVPINCKLFGDEYVTYTIDKYSGFNNKIGDIILAFVFNIMGNSLKFKQAMDDINNDFKNQFYTDIAQQYGKILRLTLDFSADDLSAASLSSSEEQMRQIQTDNPVFQYILNNVNNETVQPVARKIEQFIDHAKEMKRVYAQGGLMSLFDKEVSNLIRSFAGEDAVQILDKLNTSELNEMLATFTGVSDAYSFGSGFVNGMINVLPTQSFLRYCRDNVTLINTEQTKFKTYWGSDYNLALTSLQLMLEGFGESSFNCFYSVKDPTASGQTSGTGLKYIGWNVLYNLGYMYTDKIGKNLENILEIS